MNHQTVELVNRGEVLLKGNRKLTTISFSSHFPSEKRRYCQCTPKAPKAYAKLLQKLERNKTVVTLYISGMLSMDCLITAFTWGVQDGTKDYYYELSFTEYVETVKKTSTGKKSTSTTTKKKTSSTPHRTTNKKSTTYTIKKGDTLSLIAKKKLGKSSLASTLYKNNKTVIETAAKKHGRKSSANGHYIYPGTKLVIKHE